MDHRRRKNQGGRPRAYDWEALFAKGRFVLRRHVDFTCKPTSAQQQARNAASRLGLWIEAKLEGDDLKVKVLEGPDAKG